MNQTVTTVLASILAGFAGGIAGGVAAATVQRRSRRAGPGTLLIPSEGIGHHYTIAKVDHICWVDDLGLVRLFEWAYSVDEFEGGYKVVFPPFEHVEGLTVWFRVTSLAAPQQVGRLFEVKGVDAVRALRGPLKILEESDQVKRVVVRMVGTTVRDYFERQVESLNGGHNG